MIPEAFDYVRPETLDEALAALADGATALAGGHSLLPTLKLRLGAPERLVDIGRLEELKGISVDADELVIGAGTRYADVLRSDAVRAEAALLHSAVATIGDPQVRNRGTIGGAVAYGDAHGDAPTAVLALDATVVLQGRNGERRVAADDFFLDYFETARAEDELVTAIRIPRGQPRGNYQKFGRREMDWAIIASGVTLRGGAWRVAITAAGPTPLRARGVEEALAAGASISEAAARAGEGLDPTPGLEGSAEYKLHLACVLTQRALEAA